jgi:dsDNA-specific endonuclease/ATPase MutS2
MLFSYIDNLYDNKLLEKHNLDIVTDTGEIKDTASRELFQIRQEINIKSARLRSRINKIVRQFLILKCCKKNSSLYGKGVLLFQ